MFKDYIAAVMEVDRLSEEITKLITLTDFAGAARLGEEMVEWADMAHQLYVRLKMH